MQKRLLLICVCHVKFKILIYQMSQNFKSNRLSKNNFIHLCQISLLKCCTPHSVRHFSFFSTTTILIIIKFDKINFKFH